METAKEKALSKFQGDKRSIDEVKKSILALTEDEIFEISMFVLDLQSENIKNF